MFVCVAVSAGAYKKLPFLCDKGDRMDVARIELDVKSVAQSEVVPYG